MNHSDAAGQLLALYGIADAGPRLRELLTRALVLTDAVLGGDTSGFTRANEGELTHLVELGPELASPIGRWERRELARDWSATVLGGGGGARARRAAPRGDG